jgi:hypothetical protein
MTVEPNLALTDKTFTVADGDMTIGPDNAFPIASLAAPIYLDSVMST